MLEWLPGLLNSYWRKFLIILMQSLTTKCMYMYWASCIHEAKKLEFIIFFSYLLFSRSRSHNCFYFSFVFFILCFIFQLVYSLNTVRDYGTILCSAENELGQQSQPCVFHLISAGKQKDSLFNNNIRIFMVQFRKPSLFWYYVLRNPNYTRGI